MVSAEVRHWVQYYETDRLGIVHYSNYYRWFDKARHELFRGIGYKYQHTEDRGLFIVMAEAHCEYRYPARFEDELLIRAMVKRLGRKSIQFEYEVLNAHTRKSLALGGTTQVFVNEEGQSTQIPEDIRLLFHLRIPEEGEG